jgi:hypothetical protein
VQLNSIAALHHTAMRMVIAILRAAWNSIMALVKMYFVLACDRDEEATHRCLLWMA